MPKWRENTKKTNSKISDANYQVLTLFADDRERKQTGIQSIFRGEFASSIQFMFSRFFFCFFRFILKLISLICLIHAPSSQTAKSAVEYRATQSQFFILLIPFSLQNFFGKVSLCCCAFLFHLCNFLSLILLFIQNINTADSLKCWRRCPREHLIIHNNK